MYKNLAANLYMLAVNCKGSSYALHQYYILKYTNLGNFFAQRITAYIFFTDSKKTESLLLRIFLRRGHCYGIFHHSGRYPMSNNHVRISWINIFVKFLTKLASRFLALLVSTNEMTFCRKHCPKNFVTLQTQHLVSLALHWNQCCLLIVI